MSRIGSRPAGARAVVGFAGLWPRRRSAWSLPEADLLRLVGVRGGRPQPWANPTLHDHVGRRLTTPDLWFDDVALAVMVHSRTFHSGVLDWEATVAADEDLRAAGIEVVAVTPASIATEPERVLARVDAAYARALADPDRPAWWCGPKPACGRSPKRPRSGWMVVNTTEWPLRRPL